MGSIKNTDIPLLSRIMSDMLEARILEDKEQFIRDRMLKVTRSISGMPPGGGGGAGMDETFARISELEDRQRQEMDFLSREMAEAEELLNRITDRNMRVFVEMVYIQHKSKRQVCREMLMSDWEYRQARQAVESAENMEKVRWSWPGNKE